MIGKIIHLRKTYHFGPQKISMYLKRYHDIQVSTSGVWRSFSGWTCKRRKLPTLPPPYRSLEALREAPARAPGAGRREVRCTAEGLAQEALPVHRDR